MESKKILIIEDERVLADVLKAKLEKEGYILEVAYDGEDGYNKIISWTPDLILMDIVMPKMNGYEILERKKAEGNQVPVIVISNSGQPVELDKTKELGAVDCLVKTQFDPSEVIIKVNNFLKKEGGSEIASANLSQPATTGGGKIKVLLVEDDKFLRDICGTKLIKEGFEVVQATDGQEVVRAIEKERPDITLLDIVLPTMNGFDILASIRSHANPEVAKTPVLMLSNLGQDDDVKKAMELGANDFLIKANFTTEEIARKIRKTLNLKTENPTA